MKSAPKRLPGCTPVTRKRLLNWSALCLFTVLTSACNQEPATDKQETSAGDDPAPVPTEAAVLSTDPDGSAATAALNTAGTSGTATEATQSANQGCLASSDWLTADSMPTNSEQDEALCSPQQFAWQAFLYLANKSTSGVPRFMTWMPSYGVFVEPGKQPVPYGKHPPDKCSAATAIDTATSAATSKATSEATSQATATKTVDASALPATGTLPAFYSNLIKQAGSNQPLIDHDNKFVWYSIAVNAPAYDMLTQCELYKEGCAGNLVPGGSGVDMQNYQHLAFPNGAVELKGSWKVLTQKEIDSNLFYTTTGNIQIPAAGGECALATLGLVGLHIVAKTPQDPSLTWATFEHRANAPLCTDLTAKPPIGEDWNFFSVSACEDCVTNEYEDNTPAQVCRMHPQGNSSVGIWPDGKDCDVDGSRHLCGKETLEMLRKNSASIISINQSARDIIVDNNKLIDPVWANYELTGNVWMKDGIDLQQVNYMAGSLSAANTTMETFVQNGQAGQTADNNCFSCHTRSLGNGQYLPPAGLSHIYDKIEKGTGGCETGELPLACKVYYDHSQ